MGCSTKCNAMQFDAVDLDDVIRWININSRKHSFDPAYLSFTQRNFVAFFGLFLMKDGNRPTGECGKEQ